MRNAGTRRYGAIPGTFAALAALCLSGALLGSCAEREDESGAAGAASGAGGGEGGAPSGPPPVPVMIAPVEERAYAPAIELVGDVRAQQRAMLAAEVSGRVLRISRRVGESAGRGSALITIDPATYQAGLSSAQANLEQARQQLAQLEAGPRGTELEVQRSAVAGAQARYDAARDNLQRQEQLYAEGVIAESALVAARSSAEAAASELRAQEQRLDELQQGSRVEEVAAARARVDFAISSVEMARLSLQRTTVTPPFDAVVSQLLVEEGQYVGPGIPLAEVVAAEPGRDRIDVEAWFNVAEGQARGIEPGGLVELRSAAIGEGVIQGRVISVAPGADPVSRQFPVRVSFDDPRLRPGMTVNARLLLAEPAPVLMIPADSTTTSTLGLIVYRMLPPGGEGELPAVEAVTVTLGDHVDAYIVVEGSELRPGDIVVTRGKEQLYPGARIVPANADAAGGPPGAAGGGPPGADESAATDTTEPESSGADAPATGETTAP